MDAVSIALLNRAKDALALVSNDNERARRARNYTRSILARAINFAKIDSRGTAELAKSFWPDDAAVITRAATGALTGTQTAEHAAFFGLLAEQTILGKAPIRRWPFRVRTLVSGGIAGAEVPEGGATPIRLPNLAAFRLAERKFQAALLLTRESLELGGPVVEEGLQSDLLRAASDAVDAAFVADLIAADSTGGFAGDHRFAVMLLNPVDAAANATDTLNVAGGWFRGYPAFVSNAVAPDTAILVDASRVAADWTGGEIDFADQAMVQADTEPTNNSITPTPTQGVSLFQSNTIAVRATMRADWHISDGAVEVIGLGS